VFDNCAAMIDGFKAYYQRHNHRLDENPSPGNIQGGITTLEEKSLGCVQKGGTSPVVDVLDYGQPIAQPGLSLVSAPGNDLISTTALTAAGAQIILFTTGRGTPLGGPVPTLKISTTNQLAARKKTWIDFDAGTLLAGESMTAAADRLLDLILAVAAGRRIRNEENDCREIAIFKDGVTL
jgi:altronate hydrolase